MTPPLSGVPFWVNPDAVVVADSCVVANRKLGHERQTGHLTFRCMFAYRWILVRKGGIVNRLARHSVADEVAGRRLRHRGHVARFRGGSVARRRRAAG